MFDLDDNKSGFFVRANARTQQSRSQLRWPHDRQRSWRDAKMNENAPYFRLPLLLAKHFLPTVCENPTSPSLRWWGRWGHGARLQCGWSGFIVCINNTPFRILWPLYCCSRMLQNAYSSTSFRGRAPRKWSHGYFPKTISSLSHRRLNDGKKSSHSIPKHTLWRTDYSEPSVFTEGSRVWKPLIKGNLVEKFPPKGDYNLTTSLRCHISLHPHHSDFALYITHITHIHIAHHSPRVMWWDVASQIPHINHISPYTCDFSCQAQSLMILEGYFYGRGNFDNIGVLFFVACGIFGAGGIFGDIRMLIK